MYIAHVYVHVYDKHIIIYMYIVYEYVVHMYYYTHVLNVQCMYVVHEHVHVYICTIIKCTCMWFYLYM